MEKYLVEAFAVLLIILITFMKDGYQWYKTNGKLRFFNQNIELDVQIQKELKYLVDKMGFNRCSIIKYHNGTESFDGFSFNYATMTHEATDDVTVSLLGEFQKVPITSFADSLKELKDSDERYHVINSDNSSSGIMQAGWNVDQSWNFMLSDRIFDGVVCCAMTHGKKELSAAEILEVRAVAYKINHLLNKRR